MGVELIDVGSVQIADSAGVCADTCVVRRKKEVTVARAVMIGGAVVGVSCPKSLPSSQGAVILFDEHT